MSTLFLIFQNALVFMLTNQIYPGWEWQFFAIVLANSVLIEAVVISRKLED